MYLVTDREERHSMYIHKTNTFSSNALVLYHGSHKGLVGSIRADASRPMCDFGVGFYTGDMPDQAKSLIVDDKDGMLYTLSIQLDCFSIYHFESEIEWALYVGVNRGYIDASEFKKLSDRIAYIDSHDIVAGLVADDRMSTVYPEFINGSITDAALVEALKHVRYGNQYVFKNNAACAKITISGSSKLSEDEKLKLRHSKHITLGELVDKVELIKKQFRRRGEYIDEILERWR